MLANITSQVQAAALLAADDDITLDPTSTVNRARLILIAVLSAGLILVSVAAVFGPGRKGNTRRTVDILLATVIALIPGVIGALGVGLAVGAAFLGWAIPGIS